MPSLLEDTAVNLFKDFFQIFYKRNLEHLINKKLSLSESAKFSLLVLFFGVILSIISFVIPTILEKGINGTCRKYIGHTLTSYSCTLDIFYSILNLSLLLSFLIITSLTVFILIQFSIANIFGGKFNLGIVSFFSNSIFLFFSMLLLAFLYSIFLFFSMLLLAFLLNISIFELRNVLLNLFLVVLFPIYTLFLQIKLVQKTTGLSLLSSILTVFIPLAIAGLILGVILIYGIGMAGLTGRF
ncbi:MAG: hypothetical protein NUV67_03295 [archaeon]|nr:hypothetical protein [archaeon]